MLGWGSCSSQAYLKDLNSIVSEICLKSTAKRMNIWDLHFQVGAQGTIFGVRKSKEVDLLNSDNKVLHLQMCNYFSVGQESKVGFQVELNRTTNRKCNIICYVLQGLKVLCSCSLFQNEKQSLWELLERVTVQKGQTNEVVFTSTKSPRGPYLKQAQRTLFVQNISSCLGGR